MAAYSMDLRTRVLADWDAGGKAEEVAAKYRVSRAWVHRLVQRRRKRGRSGRDVRPSFGRGRSPTRKTASSPW
jgi:Mor family transcriptional regulator